MMVPDYGQVVVEKISSMNASGKSLCDLFQELVQPMLSKYRARIKHIIAFIKIY